MSAFVVSWSFVQELGKMPTESCGAAKTLVARRARRARAEYLRKPIALVNWVEKGAVGLVEDGSSDDDDAARCELHFL